MRALLQMVCQPSGRRQSRPVESTTPRTSETTPRVSAAFPPRRGAIHRRTSRSPLSTGASRSSRNGAGTARRATSQKVESGKYCHEAAHFPTGWQPEERWGEPSPEDSFPGGEARPGSARRVGAREGGPRGRQVGGVGPELQPGWPVRAKLQVGRLPLYKSLLYNMVRHVPGWALLSPGLAPARGPCRNHEAWRGCLGGSQPQQGRRNSGACESSGGTTLNRSEQMRTPQRMTTAGRSHEAESTCCP